jgi:predicted DNA-binding WGR domain protein
MRFANRRDSQLTQLLNASDSYDAPSAPSLGETPLMPIDLSGAFTSPTVRLERIRPAQNERRFYAVSVVTDLFGNVLLFRNWGRIGTGGRVRFDLYSDTLAATSAMETLARAKWRRGYDHRAVQHMSTLSS